MALTAVIVPIDRRNLIFHQLHASTPRFLLSNHHINRTSPAQTHEQKALKIRFPDSRIHVYGSDKDSVESYDWGPEGRFPTAHFWDPQVKEV